MAPATSHLSVERPVGTGRPLRSQTGVDARARAENSPGRQVADALERFSTAIRRYGTNASQYLSIV